MESNKYWMVRLNAAAGSWTTLVTYLVPTGRALIVTEIVIGATLVDAFARMQVNRAGSAMVYLGFKAPFRFTACASRGLIWSAGQTIQVQVMPDAGNDSHYSAQVRGIEYPL